MDRKLKLIYAAVMLFAAFIIVGGKVPAVGRLFMVKEPAGRISGDLYRLSELERFKEEIPVVREAPMGSLAESDVLTLGDSFFNSNLGSDVFATELARKSGHKVYNLQSPTFFEPQSYPLSFLESIGYRGDKRRTLILESVERTVLDRGETYNARGGASGSNQIDALAFKVLKNSDVEYFFKNNIFVHPLEKWLKNIRFDYFKIVDRSVGAYSENPDMLFYQREVDFGRLRKTDAMVDAAAQSIARLSRTLKERFDLDMIYVAIPNKYSLYHDLVHDGYLYDDFVPRLSRRLSELGVKNVDLYAVYSRYRKQGGAPLYYTTDTHYTPLGKEILVDECAKMIAAAGKVQVPSTLAER